MIAKDLIEQVVSGDDPAFVLDERMSLNARSYVASHGKDPSGVGNWMFSFVEPSKAGPKDTFEPGPGLGFKDAKKKATKEAGKRGMTTVYVMP